MIVCKRSLRDDFLELVQGLYSVHIRIVIPPSTGMREPVIMDDFSLSRNKVAFATSSTAGKESVAKMVTFIMFINK